MNYYAQKLPNTIGVENPTFIYSFFNEFGCFSIVEIPQRQEWDCYIASKFEQQPSLLLINKINQTEYIKRNVYRKRTYLMLTSKFIQSQIKLTNSFWGIKVNQTKDNTGDGSMC